MIFSNTPFHISKCKIDFHTYPFPKCPAKCLLDHSNNNPIQQVTLSDHVCYKQVPSVPNLGKHRVASSIEKTRQYNFLSLAFFFHVLDCLDKARPAIPPFVKLCLFYAYNDPSNEPPLSLSYLNICIPDQPCFRNVLQPPSSGNTSSYGFEPLQFGYSRCPCKESLRRSRSRKSMAHALQSCF